MSVTGKKLIIKGADYTDISVVEVEAKTLKSIAVTTQPSKTTYAVGESFSPAGMIVTATFEGVTTHTQTTQTVSNYTYSPTTAFDSTGNKTITISYTYQGTTKTTTLSVTVSDTPVTTYTITGSITNGSLTGAQTITAGGNASVTISPSTGYRVPTNASDITVVGATKGTYSNGVLQLTNATGNVTVTATCPTQQVTDTWYTDISMTGSSAVNVQGYGWVNNSSTMQSQLVGNPVNLVKFHTDNTSGSFEIGKCAVNAETVTDIQSVAWDSSNKVGDVVTVVLPASMTLSAGEVFVLYPQTQPATGAFKFGGSFTGDFYSDVPISRRSSTAWKRTPNYCLDHNFGYRG